MALVDYSDSESEGEHPAASVKLAAPSTKPAFQKAAPGKLQVSLPSLKPEPDQSHNTDGNKYGEGLVAEGPPTKRARTAGAFSGFNALLPAPKKAAAAPNAMKKSVSLKTSSEAAFSRTALPPQVAQEETDLETDLVLAASHVQIIKGIADKLEDTAPEPKLLGKNTRFLPLSVSGKKKKKPMAKQLDTMKVNAETKPEAATTQAAAEIPQSQETLKPKPKPKRSLFSVTSEEQSTPDEANGAMYEPIILERPSNTASAPQDMVEQDTAPATSNSLESIADDMNLTPAQRRQLFGRGGKDANVMHFNLDAQYRENERARQAGEVVEHRAVKAVAAGKHSLQQLVNNARSQQDGLQDKWAEGRRNRGEGGSKYGWS